MKTRIFVSSPPKKYIGHQAGRFRGISGWRVSVENHKLVLESVRTLGFNRALALVSKFLDIYPEAEVVLPKGLHNVQVVG